ncbi:DUF2585 family protein [Nitratireductor sp. GCM10026969]|uniref:DUF2585 family protein n=1 Tax=Nitratireductor sp. GCM10026969 TaxID=3252645 RepID=UPI00361638A2
MTENAQFSPDTAARWRFLALCTLAAAGIIAVQAIVLHLLGQPAICDCGYIAWWYPDSSGPQTSQHIADWYSFSHLLHGLIFYFLFWLLAPRASFGTRLILAVALEAGWEIAENTPMVIDRYRQTALAQGYFGDSIVNSLSDTLAAVIGFFLARAWPVWMSVLVVVAVELVLAYAIRDNLTLNILQLIHPVDAVSRWQTGG